MAEVLLSPHTAHRISGTSGTHGKASGAHVPSLARCALEAHLGSLEAHVTKQGAGQGAGLTYLLPRLARSALRSWRALQEAKHSVVERVLGRPLDRGGDPHSHRRYKQPRDPPFSSVGRWGN